MSYTVTDRETTSVLLEGKLCPSTHLSGTVVTVNLQMTTACDWSNGYFSWEPYDILLPQGVFQE